MKTIVYSFVVLSWLLCTSAHAAGGGNTQGVLLAGAGFDWQRTGTNPQGVPSFSTHQFPPQMPSNPKLTAPWMAVEITLENCSNANAPWAECQAKVELKDKFPESWFCGRWVERNAAERFHLFAIDASPDGKGGFNFDRAGTTSERKFTVACGVENVDDIKDVEWNALGAIGKCLVWKPAGFRPTADLKEFKSCIRAVRADYCGDGVAHTKDSTIIDLYRVSQADAHRPMPAFLLEANWAEKGAICVIHARYVSLPAECRRRFNLEFSFFKPGHESGADYWCRSSAKPPTGCDPNGECNFVLAFEKLLRSGVLIDDSMLQP